MGDLPDDRILNVSENDVYPQNAGFRGTEFSGAEIPGLLQTHDGQIIGLFGAEMGHFYSLSIQFPQLEFRVSINWEVDGNSVLAVTVYIFPSLFFSMFLPTDWSSRALEKSCVFPRGWGVWVTVWVTAGSAQTFDNAWRPIRGQCLPYRQEQQSCFQQQDLAPAFTGALGPRYKFLGEEQWDWSHFSKSRLENQEPLTQQMALFKTGWDTGCRKLWEFGWWWRRWRWGWRRWRRGGGWWWSWSWWCTYIYRCIHMYTYINVHRYRYT